jgi:hypothetical protein
MDARADRHIRDPLRSYSRLGKDNGRFQGEDTTKIDTFEAKQQTPSHLTVRTLFRRVETATAIRNASWPLARFAR